MASAKFRAGTNDFLVTLDDGSTRIAQSHDEAVAIMNGGPTAEQQSRNAPTVKLDPNRSIAFGDVNQGTSAPSIPPVGSNTPPPKSTSGSTFTPDPRFFSQSEIDNILKAQSVVSGSSDLPSSTGSGQTGGTGTGVGTLADFDADDNFTFNPSDYDTSGLDRPSTPSPFSFSPGTLTPRGEAPEGHLVEFSSVLSQIVEASRQKREAYQNEFIPTQVPLGAMSASNFTSILNKISANSSQFSRDLAGSGFKAATAEADRDQRNFELARNEEVDQFNRRETQRFNTEVNAQNNRQRNFELQLQEFNTNQSNIQNLALEASKNGAPSVVVNSITQAGSLGAAVNMANDFLKKRNMEVITNNKTGETIVLTTDGTDIIAKKTLFGPTAAGSTGKAGEGQTTLGLNDVRFDADGNIIATGAGVDAQGNRIPDSPSGEKPKDILSRESFGRAEKFITDNPNGTFNELLVGLQRMRAENRIDLTDTEMKNLLQNKAVVRSTASLTGSASLEDGEIDQKAKAEIDKVSGFTTTRKTEKAAAVKAITENPFIEIDGVTFRLSEKDLQRIIDSINKNTLFGND